MFDTGSYRSSEEVQRHNHELFVKTEAEKEKVVTQEGTRIKKLLDTYIEQHGSTVGVRAEAEKKKRDNSYQLDLSADLVEILTQIKSKVR